MGKLCPIKRNVCLDASTNEPGNLNGYVIPNYCQSSSLSASFLWPLYLIPGGQAAFFGLGYAGGILYGVAESTDTVGKFCTGAGFGGLTQTLNADSYYGLGEFSSKGTNGPFNSCKASDIARGDTCTAVNPAIIPGETGACTKQANFGDPLVCCLRDYQCNGGGDLFGDGCFTSDYNSPGGAQQSCGPEFKATDTEPCQYLTTQYCLGNYSNGASAVTPLEPGLDFTALWINSDFKVNPLPAGTQYRTNKDISISTFCPLNPKDGTPLPGTECTRSGTVQPVHDINTYQSETQPICQKIFWRTLFGNQPSFKNQNWKPFGSKVTCASGENICAESSSLPSQAACGAIPFGGDPSETGIAWATGMFDSIYDKLKAKGTSLTQAANEGADKPMIEWMFTVCSKYPQICQNILKQECEGVNPAEFPINLNKWNWCGCYMADDKYEKYTDRFSIQKECTPFCNVSTAIPALNGNTNLPLRCTQNVCLIDDVAITLAKTRFQNTTNNINFSQICNGCGSGYTGSAINQSGIQNNTGNSNQNTTITTSCQCVMNNLTLNTLGANIVGGINLSQSCNGNAKCYNTFTKADGTETTTEIDCGNSGSNVNQFIEEQKAKLALKAENTANYWAIFIGFVVLCLIAILWILFSPSGVPEKEITFTKYIPPPKSAPISKLERKLDASNKTVKSLKSSIQDLQNTIVSFQTPTTITPFF